MKRSPLSFAFGSIAAALFSTAAMADHNSLNGAGWANMPNDIHNIQIEDDLSSTEFRDLVKNGGVRELPNRYDTDSVSRGSSSDRATVQRGGSRNSR